MDFNNGIYGYQPQYSYMQRQQSIVKVNGENGAKAYQMAPNSSVLLLDENAPIVWLKTTDGAGYPNLVPYDIAPHQPEPQIDVKSFDSRLSRLEGIVNESYIRNDARQTAEQSNE